MKGIPTFNTGTEPEANLQPFHFNPNMLSVEEWEEMGLPLRLARAVRNYLAAGGTFRVREDLQRIYLMKDAWYNQLEPYINLPSKDDQQAVASLSNQYQQEERNTYPDRNNPVITDRQPGKKMLKILWPMCHPVQVTLNVPIRISIYHL
jgi:hypothetical protein